MSKLLVDDIRKFMTEGYGEELNEAKGGDLNAIDLGVFSQLWGGKISNSAVGKTVSVTGRTTDTQFNVEIYADGSGVVQTVNKCPILFEQDSSLIRYLIEDLEKFYTKLKNDVQLLKKAKFVQNIAMENFIGDLNTVCYEMPMELKKLIGALKKSAYYDKDKE
jgi:hypothetical protein